MSVGVVTIFDVAALGDVVEAVCVFHDGGLVTNFCCCCICSHCWFCGIVGIFGIAGVVDVVGMVCIIAVVHIFLCCCFARFVDVVPCGIAIGGAVHHNVIV